MDFVTISLSLLLLLFHCFCFCFLLLYSEHFQGPGVCCLWLAALSPSPYKHLRALLPIF